MWTLLRTCATQIDAKLLVGLLETASIDSRITSGDSGGMTPHLATAHGFRVEVASEQKEAAEELLEAGPVAPPPELDDGA